MKPARGIYFPRILHPDEIAAIQALLQLKNYVKK
jgi:hypothetical protein